MASRLSRPRAVAQTDNQAQARRARGHPRCIRGAASAAAGTLPAPNSERHGRRRVARMADSAALAASVTPSVGLLTRISLRALLMTRIKLAVSLTAVAAALTAFAIPIARLGLAANATESSPVLQSRQQEIHRLKRTDRADSQPGACPAGFASDLRLPPPGGSGHAENR